MSMNRHGVCSVKLFKVRDVELLGRKSINKHLTLLCRTSANRYYRQNVVGSDEESVKSTLKAYFDALNDSDAKRCVSLYAQDGVTMAPGFPTQEGIDNITEWYKNTFKAITLTVTLDIKEAHVVSDQYAFARTASKGTQKINSTGETSKESNSELFVLKKVDGEWKIARYCFCSTNPPK